MRRPGRSSQAGETSTTDTYGTSRSMRSIAVSSSTSSIDDRYR